MSEEVAVRTRDKWVDDVKVIACINQSGWNSFLYPNKVMRSISKCKN